MATKHKAVTPDDPQESAADLVATIARLTGAAMMRAPPAAFTLQQAIVAYSVVSHLGAQIEARKEVLRADLLARADREGYRDPKGRLGLAVPGAGTITIEERRQRAITKKYEEAIRGVLRKHGVDPRECFDVIEIEQLNTVKLDALIEAGKVPAAEVDAHVGGSRAVKASPAPEIVAMLTGRGDV